ncbi:serine protease|nr:serine protease [Candidatus Pantoea persica]
MQRLIALMALLCEWLFRGHYEYSSEAQKRVDMTYTGIPTALGLGTLGTTIQLTRSTA